MVYFLYQHADYLMVNNLRHVANWGQVESAGLLAASIIVSEHPDAAMFRQNSPAAFRFPQPGDVFPRRGGRLRTLFTTMLFL